MRKMNFIVLCSMVGLIFSGNIFAASMEDTIKAQAEKCAKATVAGDFEGMVAGTHPSVVQMMGGKDKMIATLKESAENMKKEQTGIEAVTVGQPEQLGKTDKLSYALVPQQLQMKMPGGKLLQDGWLLAVSEDQGKNWRFVDATNLTDENVGQVF